MSFSRTNTNHDQEKTLITIREKKSLHRFRALQELIHHCSYVRKRLPG